MDQSSLSGKTICYVSSRGFAGVWRTLKQADALAERGMRVVFLGPSEVMPDVYKESEHRVEYYEQVSSRGKVSWHPIWVVRVLSNILVHNPLNSLSVKTSAIRSQISFLKMLRRIRPTFIQAVDLPGLEYAVLARRRSGARLVYDSNEYWRGFVSNPDVKVSRREVPRLLELESRGIRLADLVLTTSPELSEQLQVDYGIEPPVVLYNTPSDEHVTYAQPVHQPLKLVFHGGLSKDRNLTGLIKAMALVDGQVTLDVFGYERTESAERLRGLVERLGLSDAVTFHGPFSYRGVVQTISPYDIEIMAAPVSEENFRLTLPNKIFDAMSAGLALAMTDTPAVRTVVEPADCGVLFADPPTPEAVAHTLSELASDPDRVSEMKRNALNAASTYSWEKQVDKLTAALVRAAGTKRRGRNLGR